MRIVITGGQGQLAYDCKSILQKNHEIIALGAEELNIADRAAVQEKLQNLVPDILLNCAAYTKVDACETEQKLAWSINAQGPENLAAVMDDIGGLLIHISTDYVFDGERKPPTGYIENDVPNPLSFYGSSKLAGEKAVRAKIANYIILRTAWLYGSEGQNFLKIMLHLAINKPETMIRVVDDQYGSLTWTHSLARQIDTLISANGSGTYHATAEGHSTWYEGARYFLEKMEVPYRLSPCTTAEYPTVAHRPGNSILENKRLKRQSLCVMTNWQNDIDQFVIAYREDLLREARGDNN